MSELPAGPADGLGGQLAWGRSPALLLVDVMRAYSTPGSALCLPERAGRDAVEGCAALLALFRARGLPVLHTRVAYDDLREAGLFLAKVPALAGLVEGSPLGQHEPSVAPAAGEAVVRKHYASAFCGTSLAALLTTLRADTVVIGGLSTSGCVRATATDALQSGFAPFVVADACGDRDPAVHAANLADLQAKYAEVTHVAAVRRHLDATPGP